MLPLTPPTVSGRWETLDPRPTPRAQPCANPISLEVGSCFPFTAWVGWITNSSTQHPSPFLCWVQVLNFLFEALLLLGCQQLRSGQRYQPYLCLFVFVLGTGERLSLVPWVTQQGSERPSYLWTPSQSARQSRWECL